MPDSTGRGVDAPACGHAERVGNSEFGNELHQHNRVKIRLGTSILRAVPPNSRRCSPGLTGKWLRRFAADPRRAVLFPAVLALLLALLGAARHGLPTPRIMDEFSYLLAADTFAHGRLTNPTHPFWVHFESEHIIHRPSYQSMYPPGQGLALALGQRLGHPVIGVWLSVAAMGAAIAWMLRGFLPARWACVGSVLAVLTLVLAGRDFHRGTAGYWSQSYYGGALAATGGALLCGAVPRLVRLPAVRDALALGIGVAILANTRPYEGLALSIAVCGWLAWELWHRRGVARRGGYSRPALVLALSLAATLGGLGYYSFRVTGNSLQFPFFTHHQQYCTWPVFLWQSVREGVHWNHEALRQFHGGWEVNLYLRHLPFSRGLPRETLAKTGIIWGFFIGPVLTIPFVMSVLAWRRRWVKGAALACGAVIVANLCVAFVSPHYTAPAAGLFFLLAAAGMRELQPWRPGGRPLGAWINAAVLAGALTAVLATFAPRSGAAARLPHSVEHRNRLAGQLLAVGGKHLVVVRYGGNHDIHDEWVYNAADIDRAPVVWARDMGGEKNRELLRYFGDRTPWLLIVDAPGSVPQPTPYRELR